MKVHKKKKKKSSVFTLRSFFKGNGERPGAPPFMPPVNADVCITPTPLTVSYRSKQPAVKSGTVRLPLLLGSEGGVFRTDSAL